MKGFIRTWLAWLAIAGLLALPGQALAESRKPTTIISGRTSTLPAGDTLVDAAGRPYAKEYSVNVVDKGADASGVANSTSAFAAALTASGGSIYVPCGHFKLNLTITVPTTIVGAGSCAYLQPYATNAPVITYQGVNFSLLANLAVFNTTSTSDAVKLTAASGNVTIENVLFSGFTGGAAVNCAMTSGPANESSGLRIIQGAALANGTGYRLTYCMDSLILGGNIGLNSVAGIALDHASAGQINSAYVWENGIAVDCDTCLHAWITNSRLTQSQTNGLRVVDGQFINITNTQFYENSKASTGAAADLALSNAAYVQISGNLFYDWTGVAHTNYAITADASSSIVNITGNTFSEHHTVAPTDISPSAFKVTLAGNTPWGTNGANWSPKWSVAVSTPASGIGGTLSTAYLSTISHASENAAPAPAPGLLGCFHLFSSTQPAVGETWTFTQRIGGSDTALTATQANGSFQVSACSRTAAPATAAADGLSIKVTSSNGATNLGAVNFRGSMVGYE